MGAMDSQALVIEVRRGRLLVQPLDGIRRIWLKVPRCDRTYIENELLQLAPIPDGLPEDKPIQVEVLGNRIDPTYIDARPPALETMDEDADEYYFSEYVSFDDSESFEFAMEFYRAGQGIKAGKALRKFIAQYPLHIDSYHHLGNLSWEAGHLERALKYYEMAFKIGRLTVPVGFTGHLPWPVVENRPFLRACHGRALALMELGRFIEAAEGFSEILRLNPGDNQGVRYILPGLLAAEGSWSRARELLDQTGTDGMNLYTRCLIEIEDGRRRDALRWLCAAVSHNPYVPGVLAGEPSPDAEDDMHPGYVTMGGPSEAADYIRHNEALWRKGKGIPFLRRALRIGPFADRLARVLEIKRALDGLPPGDERSRLVQERFSLFCDDAIPSIVNECEPHL